MDILGYLIEIVSDNTLDEFFRKEIFVPLEMNDTYFYLPETKSDKLVPVQVFDSGVSYNPNNQNYLQSWSVFQDNRFNVNYPVEGERKFLQAVVGYHPQLVIIIISCLFFSMMENIKKTKSSKKPL